MSDEASGIDPYEAVLADLRAKRDQIDQAIKVIEGLRSSGTLPPGVSIAAPPAYESVDGPGAFLGMTIPDAAKKLLAARKRTLTNAEFVAAFKAGGLRMESADPMNTVGSVLTRRFHNNGDIVRVARGTWGLPEWYPNRNFKRKVPASKAEGETGAEPSEEKASDPNEPEQP